MISLFALIKTLVSAACYNFLCYNYRKAKLMQDLLQKTKLPAPTLSEPTNDSDEEWTPEDDGMKKLKDRLDEKLMGVKEVGEDKAVNDCAKDNSETDKDISLDIGKEDGNKAPSHDKLSSGDGEDSDNDSLPDIGDSDKQKINERLSPVQGDDKSVSNSAKTETEETSETSMDIDESVNQTNTGTQSRERTESDETMQVDESSSLSQTDTVNDEEKGETCSKDANDSEGMSMSVENAEKVDESSVISDISSKDNLTENKKASQNVENSTVTENDENKDPNMSMSQMGANKEKGTQDIKVTNEKKKNKLAVLASLDLDSIKPCLSGNSDAFICLEEEERMPTHPGVAKLMDRFCKHSTKKEKKHATDVDIRY